MRIQIARTCHRCGAARRPDAAFCHQCGQAFNLTPMRDLWFLTALTLVCGVGILGVIAVCQWLGDKL